MPVVHVELTTWHVGQIIDTHPRNARPGEEYVRPICSCGWKAPAYLIADRPLAQIGLKAHIATSPSEKIRHQVTLDKPVG